MMSHTEMLYGSVSMEDMLKTYVDPDTYLGYCARCPHYGERWSCPPYDFDPADVWRRYARLALAAMKIVPEGEAEKALAAAEPERYLLPFTAELTAFLRERESASPGSLRLNPGRCRVCASCARGEGKPCRRSEEMRWSIESLGGAVGALCADVLNAPLVWAPKGEAPAYFLLVGGLLKKE